MSERERRGRGVKPCRSERPENLLRIYDGPTSQIH